MKTAKILAILAVIAAIAATAQAATAESGHTKLLATTDPLHGGVSADLYLETTPGTGRIFIESYPLTKIDTQISTRFAKEAACSYTGKDCDKTDFFYTIRADAAIIGGPSAGAAMTALTIAVLNGEKLDQKTAITGTINSGGIIGHVGGLPAKIEAASDAGIKKVLIPKGETAYEMGNISASIIDYGKALGIQTAEVFTIEEAMNEFTGKTLKAEQKEIQISQRYSRLMSQLADGLCTRTKELRQKTEKSAAQAEIMQIAENLTIEGEKALNKNSAYAAASFCFGANVRYHYIQLASQNLTANEIKQELEKSGEEAERLWKKLKKPDTISNAQTLAIVLDRIEETKQHLNTSAEALRQGRKETAEFELAFATERLKSAEAWNTFYGAMQENPITQEMLKTACTNKLAEAQERAEYSATLLKSSTQSAIEHLEQAQNHLREEKYVECLHKATLAKAEANTFLSTIGAKEEEIPEIVKRKLEAAKAVIASQESKKIFPIVGYSYYEYANSLQETDKYSALLFSEYALEFSNLDVYFRQKTDKIQLQRTTKESKTTIYFAAGIIIGATITYAITRKAKRKKRKLIINRNSK